MNYKIFIISIERNEKRYNSLLAKLKNENFDESIIEIFIGIDYKTTDNKKLQNVTSSWGKYTPKSVLCCALSHILLWGHISKLNIDYAIILEDDSYIIKSLFDKYKTDIEKHVSDTTFLNLSSAFSIKKNKHDNNIFVNSNMVLALDTYILTPNLCKKLFEFYYNNGVSYHIDLHLTFIKKYVKFDLVHFNRKITQGNLRLESSMVSDHNKKFILYFLKDTETYKELNTPIIEFNDISINGYMCIVFLVFILCVILTFIFWNYIVNYCIYFTLFSGIWFVLGLLIYDLL